MGWMEGVTSVHGPWVTTLTTEAELISLQSAISAAGRPVQLDGEEMPRLDDVFAAYVRNFALPEYFGWNWPAFAESMTTLAEMPSRSYLTVIERSHRLLRDEPAELPTLLDNLEFIGKRWAGAFALGPEWGGGEVPFHTVLVPFRIRAEAALGDDDKSI